MRVKLDLSEVTALGQVRRGEFRRIAQKVVERASDEVFNEIHRQANRSLKSTRQIYKRNINRPEIKGYKGSITLTGMLPNMIEQGASPFDMKLGFSRSEKAKRKGGDWYLTIPFRFASAGALGESEAFSGVMPPEVYREAKGLRSSITLPFFGKVRQGQSLKQSTLDVIGHGTLGIRGDIAASAGGDLTDAQRSAYEHKSSIYAGMTRQKKWYQLLSQGSYVTFRRVSNKSAQNSWIHKGIKAYDLMPKALQNVDFPVIIDKVIDRELTKLGL